MLVNFGFAVGFLALLMAYMVLLVKYRQLRNPDPWEELLKRNKKGRRK